MWYLFNLSAPSALLIVAPAPVVGVDDVPEDEAAGPAMQWATARWKVPAIIFKR